jgi:MerR family transcriptional regulator, copper efflux regulator
MNVRITERLNDYLTITEAAILLGVSPDTLRNWDRADRLKPLRHPINGYRLYRREDLEAFLRRVSRGGRHS